MKDGRIEVLDVPMPALRPQGALVRTAWSLISAGTEGAKVDLGQKSLLAKARSRPDQVKQVMDKVRSEGVLRTYRTVKARLEEQSPIGYSSAGVVTQLGELAAGLAVGDRVACGGGDYANHAECAYVPATLCARVPEGVGLDEAAFATVGAVALQGVRQSGVTVGDRVAVIGLGLVGQITVQLSDAGMPVSRGDCFTVGAFVHTVGQKRFIFENTGARVIDMESASLAKRFCAAGVAFLDIRIISDTARKDVFNIEAYYACKKKAGRAGAYAYFVKNPGEILRALRLKRNVGLVGGRIADIIEKLML